MYLDQRYFDTNVIDIDDTKEIDNKDKKMFDSKFMKNKPYFSIVENYLLSSNYCYQVGFSHNKKFMELLGKNEVILANTSGGFEIFEHLYSSDWIVFYNQLLEFKQNEKQSVLELKPSDLFVINDNTKDLVDGYFQMYKDVSKQKDVSSRKLNEVYFIFNIQS